MEIDESQNDNKVKELITCPICYTLVKKPLGCPKCQCYICRDCLILNYTEKKKDYCPKCHIKIRYDEFYPAPIIDNVSNYYAKNQNEKYHENNKFFENEDKENLCKEHSYELIFYCLDCRKKLCGECIETFNNKKNIHENHNVYQIKDLEKYNLFQPIKLYEEISKNENGFTEYINKCDYNINYLNCVEEIRQKHLEDFQKIIDEKMSKMIEEKEQKKKKMIQEKEKLEENYPPLNIILNKIINENNEKEFDNLKNRIKNFDKDYNKMESSQILSSQEIKVLSIDLFESQQIIFKNINNNNNNNDSNNNDILGEEKCKVSNLNIKTSIIIATKDKIRIEVKFKKQNNYNNTSNDYLVSILLKNHNKNTNEIIHLSNHPKENNNCFIQLYKLNSLYESANSDNSITLNLIISEMKLTLE